MAIEPRDLDDGAPDARALLARAAAAPMRLARRAHAHAAELASDAGDRLDERTRVTAGRQIAAIVDAIEAALIAEVARLAGGSTLVPGRAVEALTRAGALFEADLVREIVGRVRQGDVAAALPPPSGAGASLLATLVQCGDPRVAERAATVLALENRRRSGVIGLGELPAELHHRLVWRLAAAVRAGVDGAVSQPTDRAIADAALALLAAHDEGDALEPAALRLAGALDPDVDELAPLVLEALADRRLALTVALLSHATGIAYADMREMVLDPDGARLWLVLRALDFDRAAIARIGWALAEADQARDLDAFVSALDPLMTIDPATARAAVAPYTLHPDYRAAQAALAALSAGSGR